MRCADAFPAEFLVLILTTFVPGRVALVRTGAETLLRRTSQGASL